MGQALRPIFEALNIPAYVLTQASEVTTVVDGALKLAFALEQPVAMMISTQLAGWKDEK
jgi:sulfopyruvate decarboxylase TPP-binding subunit